MAQTARPISPDITVGNWTPTPSSPSTLFDKVDEAVRDDADFISSGLAPANDVVELLFGPLTDPLSAAGHVLTYVLRKNTSGGAQIDATVAVVENATVRASQAHTNLSATFTVFTLTLSAGEANAIGDYTDLRIRVTANQS